MSRWIRQIDSPRGRDENPPRRPSSGGSQNHTPNREGYVPLTRLLTHKLPAQSRTVVGQAQPGASGTKSREGAGLIDIDVSVLTPKGATYV